MLSLATITPEPLPLLPAIKTVTSRAIPILGQLIDRIGARQLNQYQPEGGLFFKGVNFQVLEEQEGEKKTEEHLSSLLDNLKKLVDSQ